MLQLGDLRECETRRSEAIMSALGTTAWFHQTDHRHHEANLVLGKYHPAFVDEVRRAMPGDFFGAFLRDGVLSSVEASDDDDDDVPAAELSRNNRASPLPFGAFGALYKPVRDLDLNVELQPHGALLAWQVGPTGEVRVPNACVLSSSALAVAAQPAVQPCSLYGLETRIRGERKVETALDFDLHQWVRTRAYEVHAVVTKSLVKRSPLGYGRVDWACAVMGVLVRRVEGEKFFRFGSFLAITGEELVLPDAREVGWTVI